MSFDPFLKSIRTLEERDSISTLLRALVDRVYQSNTDTDSLIAELPLTPEQRDFFQKNMVNQENISSWVKELLTQLNKLETVELKIAVRLSEKQLSQIHQELLEAIGKPIILAIQTDVDLVGAAVISYAGKYVDLSLRKRAEQFFADKKPAFLSQLKTKINK